VFATRLADLIAEAVNVQFIKDLSFGAIDFQVVEDLPFGGGTALTLGDLASIS